MVLFIITAQETFCIEAIIINKAKYATQEYSSEFQSRVRFDISGSNKLDMKIIPETKKKLRFKKLTIQRKLKQFSYKFHYILHFVRIIIFTPSGI